MRAVRHAVLLAVVGLIAVSAQGVDLVVTSGSTVNVSADATYGSISVEGGGELIVDAGATLSTDIGPLLVGSTGGAGVTASMTVNGHLNIQGSTFNVGEDETHSIDIGGQSQASFTLAAGSSITASGTIAFGMDAGWTGDPNVPYPDSGYRTDVTLENGSSIVAGSFTMGAGDAMMGRPDTVVNVNGDVTFNADAYIVGGTLNINGGTLDLVDKRWTIRSAVGAVDGSSPDSDYTVFNFTGAAPLFTTTEKLNWGRLGGLQFGIVIDISDSDIPHDQWYTLILGREGSTASEAQLARLSTDSEGILRVVQGSSGVQSRIDVFISSPQLMGDVNLSGFVDDDDLSLLLAGWGTGTTWGEGDLNDSGDVGDDDLSLLLASWGDGTPPAPEAVPEPASALILLLGLPYLARRRARR